MHVRPTELGWKGLLLAATLEAAYLATAYSNLFFLLIAFCVVLGVLDCVWAVANVRGLRVVRLELPAASAGVARAVPCELRARGPRAAIRIELVADDGVHAIGEAAAIDGAATITGSLAPRARGIAAVRAVRLSSRFPLGLFVARMDLPLVAEIVTHPAPAPRALQALGASGGDAAPASTRGVATRELRPFRTGDALADVHWKATARRGQPVVREREHHGERTLVIALDRRCGAPALETALSTLAGVATAAPDDLGALHVHSQGAAFRVGCDRAARTELLRWLAGAATLPPDAAPPARPAGALLLPAARTAAIAGEGAP